MITLREASTALEVWVDGKCRVCQMSERWARSRDVSGCLTFIDINEPRDGDAPGSEQALNRSIHVRHGDGEVENGFTALCSIIETLPGWFRIARLLRMRSVHFLGTWIYRLFARHRHRIFAAAGRNRT
jgi:predicted DCC family thiol-disulfide oxidoreductase YuxK